MDILDAASQVLMGGPLHYKEICTRIQALGVTIGGKDASYTTYARLYYDIKERDELKVDQRFVFLKRGVFGLTGQTVESVKELVPKRVVVNKKHKDEDVFVRKNRQLIELGEVQKCRNCAHIEYFGPDLVAKRSGICGNSDNSERLTAFPDDPPCAFWKMRTWEQRTKDMHEAENVRIFVMKFNAQVVARNPSKRADK